MADTNKIYDDPTKYTKAPGGRTVQEPVVILPKEEEDAGGEFTPSAFSRDPSNVGGTGATMTVDPEDPYSITVTGGPIAWDAGGEEPGHTAGNRYGFQIIAPDNISDETIENNATYAYNDDPPALLKDDPNVSGQWRVFWWYPIVTGTNVTMKITLDWDGAGSRPAETWTIHFNNVTLEPEPDPSPEP